MSPQEAVQPADTVQPDLELESAIRRRRATFAQWIETYFFSQKDYYAEFRKHGRLSAAEDRIRKRYLGYRPGVFEAFETAQGPIESSYYCSGFVGAAMLTTVPGSEGGTGEPRLHIGVNVDELPLDDEDVQELSDLLARCAEVGSKANSLLTGRDRRICLELAYNVTTDVLGALDKKVGQPDLGSPVDYLIAEVEGLEAFYRSAARQRASLSYFAGMMWTFGALVAAGGLLVWALVAWGNVAWSVLGPGFAGAAFGGVGAVVSVMWRMTRGRFRVDYETGTRYLRRIGSFRPALGAVFGLVAYFGLSSGVLQLQVQPNVVGTFAFFAFAGFLAGFSERVAQDMLTRGETALTATEDEEAEDEAEEGRPRHRHRRRRRREGRRRRRARQAGRG